MAATRAWLERASGWSPPLSATLAEWWADGVGRAPDDCPTTPAGVCPHGLVSWWVLLTDVRRQAPPGHWDPGLALPSPARFDLGRPDAVAVVEAHEAAIDAGRPTYEDPATGLSVMTAKSLWDRGTCCGSGCRHCPWADGPGAA